MTALQMVSAFAGVGGFDLAGQRAGIETVVTIEVDKAARGVLHDRFPNTTHLTDITEVTADDLRAAGLDPRRTVYCAGFPCQDLSVAGRRAGMGEGTRSGLFWHIDRHLADFAPAWVVLENVPGLLSATCPCTGDGACQVDGRGPVRCPGELHAVTGGACVGGCIPAHGGTMGAVLGALGNRGYGFAYRVLDAQYFGVPQRRRRVVIVGRLGDDGRAPAQVLAEFEGSLGDIAPRPTSWARPSSRSGDGARSVGRDVVNALTANMAGAGGGVDDNTAQAGHAVASVAPTLQAGGNETGGVRPPGTTVDTAESLIVLPATFRKAQRAHDPDDCERWQADDRVDTLDASGHTARTATAVVTPITTRNATRSSSDDTAALGVGRPGDPAPSVQTTAPTAVAVLGDTTHTLTAEGHDASEDGTGRGTPIVANAITAREGKGPDSDVTTTLAHQPAVRRLTPLECERLQGYPDGHTATSDGKEQADAPRYKQMGNGLAVPVFEWVLHRLVAVDEAVAA